MANRSTAPSCFFLPLSFFLLVPWKDADESLAIDNELLCEIEAESWVNGTRGILVESRAPVLPKLEQNCSLLPGPADSRSQKAARVAAAAATEKEAGDSLYSMPWQKLQVRHIASGHNNIESILSPVFVWRLKNPQAHRLLILCKTFAADTVFAVFGQALDVDLREPDMEVSTKQDDAKRYGDPGINAALAGDTDADGPRGLPSSTTASCGKLEPKVPLPPTHLNLRLIQWFEDRKAFLLMSLIISHPVFFA